jgi:hypothetical protein
MGEKTEISSFTQHMALIERPHHSRPQPHWRVRTLDELRRQKYVTARLDPETLTVIEAKFGIPPASLADRRTLCFERSSEPRNPTVLLRLLIKTDISRALESDEDVLRLNLYRSTNAALRGGNGLDKQ